jgi:hypothetical protein
VRRAARIRAGSMTRRGSGSAPGLAIRRMISSSPPASGTHDHLQHEPVHLRLGQGVRPLLLHRVLRGEHEERLFEGERGLADGDLAFLHRLEQRALDLRRGAVDLVGEDEVGEDGALLDEELRLLLVVDEGAEEVGREEVRGELDALEARGMARARVETVRVLASPGTPSSRTCPPLRSPMSRRSTMCSCPTTTRRTSASSGATNALSRSIRSASSVISASVMGKGMRDA